MSARAITLYPGDFVIDEDRDTKQITAPEDGGLFALDFGAMTGGYSWVYSDYLTARHDFQVDGARVVEYDPDSGKYEIWKHN